MLHSFLIYNTSCKDWSTVRLVLSNMFVDMRGNVLLGCTETFWVILCFFIVYYCLQLFMHMIGDYISKINKY